MSTTPRTPATPSTHLVYPGGPACQPNCPGEWSSYHDGYADGHERAIASERERVRKAGDDPLFWEPCRDFIAPDSCYTNDGTGLWCDPCLHRARVLALLEDPS